MSDYSDATLAELSRRLEDDRRSAQANLPRDFDILLGNSKKRS